VLALGFLNAMYFPGIRTSICAIAGPQNYGKALGAVACTQQLVSVFAGPAFFWLQGRTSDGCTGFGCVSSLHRALRPPVFVFGPAGVGAAVKWLGEFGPQNGGRARGGSTGLDWFDAWTNAATGLLRGSSSQNCEGSRSSAPRSSRCYQWRRQPCCLARSCASWMGRVAAAAAAKQRPQGGGGRVVTTERWRR
jgi:hypothetical protein